MPGRISFVSGEMASILPAPVAVSQVLDLTIIDSSLPWNLHRATLLEMVELNWSASDDPGQQLAELCRAARAPGLMTLCFREAIPGVPLEWDALHGWVSSRAVTVADVGCRVASPALEVALCCDLVYLRPCGCLVLPAIEHPLAAGVLWALGRAGRPALRRGLLAGGIVDAAEALELGFVTGRLDEKAPLPLSETSSLEAMTMARDLMRAGHGDGKAGALELAAFRFLFATGDPGEGARAFLDGRAPRFDE